MKAIEDVGEAAEARTIWEEAFRSQSEPTAGPDGSGALWDPKNCIWAYFGDVNGHDLNVFGQVQGKPVVEINPPRGGRSKRLQGQFARDEQGQRWLLRKGVMTVAGRRIADAEFAERSGLPRVPVEFAGGDVENYTPVALLDAQPARIQRDLARFIAACAMVRDSEGLPQGLAKVIQRMADLGGEGDEVPEKPEFTGSYRRPAQEEIEVERIHGHVWRALSDELERRGHPCSHRRMKEHEPDLFTKTAPFVLFEIKTDRRSADVYTATGQLLHYEAMLIQESPSEAYRLVFVGRRDCPERLLTQLPRFGITWLPYDISGNNIAFDQEILDQCLSEPAASRPRRSAVTCAES